jgi:PAS domain S-box-containing protein
METTVDDAVPAPKWTAPTGWAVNPAGRAIALSAAFAAVYVTLDRISFIGALHGVNITPWSPTAGLAVALLLIKGLRYAPLVFAAELVSNATLIAPVPFVALCLGSLVVMVGYSGAAAILRRNRLHAGIQSSAHVATLLIVVIISSGLVAFGFVAAYASAGVVPWGGFVDAAVHYWVGDAIGIVVFLPPLLLLYERTQQSGASAQSKSSFQLVEIAAEAASIVVALVVVFSGLGGDHPLSLFYLLFPPLIWIATRHGLPSAGWAILAIQIGLIAGFETQDHSELTLRALQLLMFTLAATGLMLGAVVSERQRLSQALQDGEGLRRAILNTVPDGLLTIDERGRIQLINPAVEKLFGRPGKVLIGKYLSELIEGAPEMRGRPKHPVESQASAVPWEMDAKRSDGRIFPVEFSANRFDFHGIDHYAVAIRDISSRRETEARRRRHEAELAHISRVSLAGEMAAGLAHELSQPLTAITAYARGCLRLLGSATESSQLQEGMGQVVRQAERAGDILGRLREFVRGGDYQPTPTTIRALIDASMCLARADADQRDIQIEARVETGLPLVLADRIQIEQVLLNLLRNAMEAMEGTDTFRRPIVVEARRKSRHAVEITVADSGPGVLDDMKDSIFDPFVTTKPLGMGMGLSISRSIVESHGGSLRSASNVPCGAIFSFDLPTPEARASIDAEQDCLPYRR